MKPRHTQRQRAHVGFTLVEALVVVAILAILVGILVPALNAVRKNAKVTSTRSTVQSISTAIETFKADQQVGGALPPSWSPADGQGSGSPKYFEVRSPYVQGSNSTNIEVAGAGLLVWALAGADQLGTPGFRTTRSASANWAWDTDAADGGQGKRGAYALDPQTKEPFYKRSGPYVDLTKVKLSRAVQTGNTTEFIVEEELAARQEMGDGQADLKSRRKYPMFLDAFGFPILYWRADPAGQVICDEEMTAPYAGNDRGIYHYRNNRELIGNGANSLVLRPYDATKNPNPHYKLKGPGGNDPQFDPNNLSGFALYIQNKEVKVKAAPQRPDTYLLVSPGEDGIYGTADDITNFEHNGAEVERK